LFVLRPSPLAVRIRTSVIDFSKNPLKAKCNHVRRLDDVEPQRLQQLLADADRRVADLVTYDAEQAPSLDAFNSTRLDTLCAFARNARIWGSDSWRPHLSLGECV
jgi:hypothetical protein